MSELRFEWDERKEKENTLRHGVAFSEAVSSFADEFALLIHDPDHSDDEDRFILLGMSARLRVLVVCHCYRKPDDTIRIISTRKATRVEQRQYARRGAS